MATITSAPRTKRRWCAAAVALVFALPCAAVDAAQRTFVASYGNDANACSRALPCRSFAVAMAHTDDDGEVIVLDSAGYGPVTVAQSVAIVAPGGVYAGISVPAGDTGITIAGAGIRVLLRGLHVNGLAGSSTGIAFDQGAALHVERCVIGGFGSYGIYVGGAGEVFVHDTSIRGVASEAIGVHGIHSPDIAKLTIARTHLAQSGHGLYVYANARILLSDSVVARSTFNGVAASGPNGNDRADVVIDQTAIVGNGTGVFVGVIPGALGTHRIIVDDSTIAWNATGWNARNDANTDLYTRGNNVLHFNTNDAAGKAAVVLGGN